MFTTVNVPCFQVENLAPPWGKCGEKPLNFYDSYTVPKCKMDCETEYVSKACNCKDVYQPSKNGMLFANLFWILLI